MCGWNLHHHHHHHNHVPVRSLATGEGATERPSDGAWRATETYRVHAAEGMKQMVERPFLALAATSYTLALSFSRGTAEAAQSTLAGPCDWIWPFAFIHLACLFNAPQHPWSHCACCDELRLKTVPFLQPRPEKDAWLDPLESQPHCRTRRQGQPGLHSLHLVMHTLWIRNDPGPYRPRMHTADCNCDKRAASRSIGSSPRNAKEDRAEDSLVINVSDLPLLSSMLRGDRYLLSHSFISHLSAFALPALQPSFPPISLLEPLTGFPCCSPWSILRAPPSSPSVSCLPSQPSSLWASVSGHVSSLSRKSD